MTKIKVKSLFSFKKKEIDKAFSNSSFQASCLGLKLLKSSITKELNEEKHGKLLIVIPKAFGKAHERNLMRRRLRSIFYEEKLYQKPITWIIICYKESKKMDFDQLKNFMIKNLKT